MATSNIHTTFYVYALRDNRPIIDGQTNINYKHIIYIGQTCDQVYLRWIKHNSSFDSMFYKWTTKYGEDCVQLITLYTIQANSNVDNERLSKDIEKYYIQYYANNNEPLMNKQKINPPQKQPTTQFGQITKCITTNETFPSINAACIKYELDTTTFKQRVAQKLNIGIDANFNSLFWEIDNIEQLNSIQTFKNRKQQKTYNYIYILKDEYYSIPQPLYIGITQNPHKRILNHLTNASGNWILTLYRAKYPDHLISVTILYKSENLEQAQFKTADLIREYSNRYILFNKAFNINYHTNVYDFILNTFNINLKNIQESQLSAWIFNERRNEHIKQINDIFNINNIPFKINPYNNISDFDKIKNTIQYHVLQVNFQNKPAAVVFKRFKKYNTIHASAVIDTIKYMKPLLDQYPKDAKQLKNQA